MTQEEHLYRDLLDNLEQLCIENGLIGEFDPDGEPIRMTIREDPEVRNQISFDEEKNHPKAEMVFVFTMADGSLSYKIGKEINISDDLFSRFKRMFLKLHFAYLKYFHKEIVMNGSIPLKETFPVD